MLEVGFKAMLAIKSCPVDIPPEVPPDELDLKPSGDISSLLSDPLASMTEKPAPISTPLTAFIPLMPWLSHYPVCQKLVLLIQEVNLSHSQLFLHL